MYTSRAFVTRTKNYVHKSVYSLPTYPAPLILSKNRVIKVTASLARFRVKKCLLICGSVL